VNLSSWDSRGSGDLATEIEVEVVDEYTRDVARMYEIWMQKRERKREGEYLCLAF